MKIVLCAVLLCVAATEVWGGRVAEGRVLQLRTAVPRDAPPPAYMLHLHNRYRKGRVPPGAANTVRSFFPTPGRLGNDDILVFNLTGVHPSEYVERVDLHLHAKRHLPFEPKKRSGLRVEVLDLSRPDRPRVETVPLARAQAGGWQTLDLTDSVIACLESEGEEHHLVGVVIKGQERDGTLNDVTKVVSKPFLVLFSEDDDHMQIQQLERKKDPKRLRREILDNELPDYPLLDNTARAEVQARLKYRPLDTAIPKPEARVVSLADVEKHRKRRRRRKKDRRLPHPWGRGWWQKGEGPGDEDEDDEVGDEPRVEDACQKNKMVIDFAEIGWSEWVIAPKTFDASFCAGSCPHPLTKELYPSNHAMLQGLLRSLGTQEAVPALCCVPQGLMPVALLFRDEYSNVVLKNFPDMSVESCSCR